MRPYDLNSFESAPLEIRLKIYAYLLSDQNSVVLHHTNYLLNSSFTTSLFLVDKQISSEALHYFYSQNSFVAVEFNAPNFLQLLSLCLPIFYNRLDGNKCHSYGLKIKYVTDRVDSAYKLWDEPEDTPEYFVLGGRHLPNLIRMLNHHHSLVSRLEPTVSIDLEFCSQNGYFTSSEKTFRMLVNGMKGLRRLSKYGNDGRTITLGHPVILKTHGRISLEQTNELVASTNLPLLDSQSLVAEIEEYQKRGNKFLRAQNYGDARGEYEIVQRLAKFHSWHIEMERDPALLTKIQLLSLTTHMRLSKLWSLLKQHLRAVYEAKAAWEMVSKIVSRAPSAITMIEKASVQKRLGEAQYDHGAYKSAAETFKLACTLYPWNKGLNDKLARAREKVGEEGNGREGGSERQIL